jgi:hypothetical protein
MAKRYTTEDLFREMDGKEYPSYRELEKAVIDLFNQHLRDFPPHYSYRDAIIWADRNRWLKPHDGRFTVTFRQGAHA